MRDQFQVQTSFTYLDWRIAEKIVSDPDFNFVDVYETQIMEMSFCLFPFYETLLHKLLKSEENLQEFF